MDSFYSTFAITCPHCGTKKHIALPTGVKPESEYVLWSDGRIKCANWQMPTYTYRCTVCDKFFSLPSVDNMIAISKPIAYLDNMLPFHSLIAAIKELHGDEIAESRARLEAWWAFNEQYKDIDDIPEEDKCFNFENMQWLLNHRVHRTRGFNLMIFELYRLLGNRKMCMKMIDDFTFDKYAQQENAWLHDCKLREQQIPLNQLLSQYHAIIEDLTFALTSPLKPYIRKNVNISW